VEEYKQMMDKFVDLLLQHQADPNILNLKEESVVDVCIQKENFTMGMKLLGLEGFQVEKTSQLDNNLLHRLGVAVLDPQGSQLV